MKKRVREREDEIMNESEMETQKGRELFIFCGKGKMRHTKQVTKKSDRKGKDSAMW